MAEAMKKWPSAWTVSSLGEKAVIADLIRPIFEAGHAEPVLGHDSAALSVPEGMDVLLSTDRVPSDLTAFRLGLMSYWDLGKYLATLNFSDIAASGGRPQGLLLNLGLPASLLLSDLQSFCAGVRAICDTLDTRVLGGDITSSNQLSVSATAVGFVCRGRALRRGGARDGDFVFATSPIGLTSAALVYFLGGRSGVVGESIVLKLVAQFTALTPQIERGIALAEGGRCTACIDNTDGVGQSLLHIAEESRVAIVIERRRLEIAPAVQAVAEMFSMEPLDLALGPGADFSLLGTLNAACEDVAIEICNDLGLLLIGRVAKGSGVFIKNCERVDQITIRGWNYFSDTEWKK